jgi:hypothetical protein
MGSQLLKIHKNSNICTVGGYASPKTFDGASKFSAQHALAGETKIFFPQPGRIPRPKSHGYRAFCYYTIANDCHRWNTCPNMAVAEVAA